MDMERNPVGPDRIKAVIDFVTFEAETSLVWPWAVPAEEIVNDRETLLAIAAAAPFDGTDGFDTDGLYDAVDRIVGRNPALG